MKRQYHIRQAGDVDEKQVEQIFANAAARFRLVETKLGCREAGIICNYSEGLGWGFGLGALRVGDLICVGLNPAKSSAERFSPVFDYIVNELTRVFGERAFLEAKSQEIDPTTLPRVHVTDEHRAFAQRLFNRDRSNDK
jgi:hypothetical protein